MTTPFPSNPGFALPGAITPGQPGAPGSPLPPDSLNVINQWEIVDTNGYGPVQTAVSNTTGNTLVAFIAVATDSQISGNPGYPPRLTVSDNAHNLWQFAGSEYGGGSGVSRRVDVWVCVNAEAANLVCVASNIIYAGMLGSICEVTGFPEWAEVETTVGNLLIGNFATATINTVNTDYILGASYTFGGTPAPGSVAWVFTAEPGDDILTTYQSTNAGTTDMSQIEGQGFIWNGPIPSGSFTVTQSWTNTLYFSMVIVAFRAVPFSPATQPNPNWPGMKVEAAFGFQPGNLSGAMPVWTDITSRAIGDNGTAIMTTSRGRDYELTQPEAGTLQLALNNQDGAFNPANTGSPFYPNVVPEVPLRISAYWAGQQYVLGYWYVNKWTQDFPFAQWGFIDLEASDAIGIASQGQLPSALAGQVLADWAYSYWPLGEYYQNAHGFLFSNLSRGNQKPMVGYSPAGFGVSGTAPLALETGQTLNLAGDPATGIGMTNFVLSGLNGLEGGSGAIIRDYGFPPLANGAAFEFWAASIPKGALASECQMLNVMGIPSSYYPSSFNAPNGTRLVVSVTYVSPNYQWQAILYAPNGGSIFTLTGTSNAVNLNNVVVNVTSSGITWSGAMFVNGNQIATGSGTYSGVLDFSVLTVGPMIPTGGIALVNNWAIGQVAVYPWALPLQRISEHYTTGNKANSGDNVTQRLGKLFQWSALSSLPVGSYWPSPTPQIGNADQIQGTGLADALYALSLDEGGFYYAPATLNGEIWYATRTSLYNQHSTATFGDNGTTEIPYDAGLGFDYSDQYLFNIVSSQRTISAGTQLFVGPQNPAQASTQNYDNYGVNAVAADQTSEQEYFSRGPLQQDIETTSDQDAYDRANWSLAKYKQPQLRANEIVVHCAAYPNAFATMLAIEQGDIVTVKRRPIGAPVISLQCIVQKVQHTTGPDLWDVTLTLAPYFPENAVIQMDVSGHNVIGSNDLGW